MKQQIMLLFILIFLLTGCTQALPAASSGPAGESTASPFSSTSPSPATTSPQQTGEVDLGSLGVGPAEERQKDSRGSFLNYEGGEMRMPYFLESTGSIRQCGIGILLFVDGQPQPYRLSDAEEYTYMHVFYPDAPKITFDLCFVPVTGSEGDELEVYIEALPSPEYMPSQGPQNRMVYTSGSTGGGTRLKYLADPPAAVFPEKSLRLSTPKIQKTDCTYSDVVGWTDADWKEKVSSRFQINGQPENGPNRIYEITAQEKVPLHYEVWGCENLRSTLVIFVDNVPVFGPEGQLPDLPLENGKKTVVDMALDMTDFTGESVIYAIRVPRNYRSSGVGPYGDLTPERTWFLLAGADPGK